MNIKNRIYISIIVACITGMIAISALILTYTDDKDFTEIYFLDQNILPEKNTVTFRYGITNKKNIPRDYEVSFLIDGMVIKKRDITVKENNTFIEKYNLTFNTEDDNEHKISIEVKYQDNIERIYFWTKT